MPMNKFGYNPKMSTRRPSLPLLGPTLVTWYSKGTVMPQQLSND